MKMHVRRAMHFSGRSAISCSCADSGDSRAPYRTMRLILHILLVVIFASSALPRSAASATTGRFWTYFNLAALVSNNWSFVAMPGVRYEFARTDDALLRPRKEFYFYELLIGPTYARTWGRFSMKLPFWYYYMGFPSKDAYDFSHNIEFLPIFNFRAGKILLTSRTIFHNTVYASVYETPELRKGYSLVIRQYFEMAYGLNQRLSLQLADEPFFGVLEDSEAPPSAIGFWPTGFRLNRIYAGLKFQVTPYFSLAPLYVFETAYDEGRVTDTNHYIFLSFNYLLKLF